MKRRRADARAPAVLDWGHPLAQGLVGCWPFSERGGLVVEDLALGRRAGLVNGYAWGVGRMGPHVDFDGTAAQFSSPALSPRAVQAFTAECWVCVDVAPGAQRTFMAHRGPVLTSWRFTLEASAAVGFEIITQAFAQVIATSTTKPTAGAGRFYQVVGTWDGVGTSTIYVDGTAQATAAPPSMFAPNGAVEIGASTDWAQALDCKVALARIWSRCLSAADVRWLYADPHCMLSYGSARAAITDGTGAPGRGVSILRSARTAPRYRAQEARRRMVAGLR